MKTLFLLMTLAFANAQAADRETYSVGRCSNLVETLKILKVHDELCQKDQSLKFVGEVLALVQNHCGYLKPVQIKRATDEVDAILLDEIKGGPTYFCEWSDFEVDRRFKKPAWTLERDDAGKLWSDK